MDSLQNQYLKRSKLRTRLGIFPDTEELWEVGWEEHQQTGSRAAPHKSGTTWRKQPVFQGLGNLFRCHHYELVLESHSLCLTLVLKMGPFSTRVRMKEMKSQETISAHFLHQCKRKRPVRKCKTTLNYFIPQIKFNEKQGREENQCLHFYNTIHWQFSHLWDCYTWVKMRESSQRGRQSSRWGPVLLSLWHIINYKTGIFILNNL